VNENNPLSLLQAADLHWDAASNVLRVAVTGPSGVISVTIPMATVAMEFRRAIGEVKAETLGAIDILGDVEILGYPLDTVGGLFGSIKHLGRSVYHAAKKTVKKVRHIATKVAKTYYHAAKWGVKQARKVVRSKYTGYALMAASVACPAVGGPAMAAWIAAKQADRALTAGGQAARAVQRGVRSLSSSKPSVFRTIGIAALQSVGESRQSQRAPTYYRAPTPTYYRAPSPTYSRAPARIPQGFNRIWW
jgi:hypothetical protein